MSVSNVTKEVIKMYANNELIHNFVDSKVEPSYLFAYMKRKLKV